MGGYGYGYGPDYMGSGYMGYGFGWVFMILVWILIIVAIVAVIRWAFGSHPSSSHPLPPPTPRKTALDILQERYAKGEIEREEFLERKRDLEG